MRSGAAGGLSADRRRRRAASWTQSSSQAGVSSFGGGFGSLEQPRLTLTSGPGQLVPVKWLCGWTSSPAPCSCQASISPASASSPASVSGVARAGHVDDGGVRAVDGAVAVRSGLHAEAPQLVGVAVRTGGVVVGDVGVVLFRVVQVGLLDAAEELRAVVVRLRRTWPPEPVDDDPVQPVWRQRRSVPRPRRAPLGSRDDRDAHRPSLST